MSAFRIWWHQNVISKLSSSKCSLTSFLPQYSFSTRTELWASEEEFFCVLTVCSLVHSGVWAREKESVTNGFLGPMGFPLLRLLQFLGNWHSASCWGKFISKWIPGFTQSSFSTGSLGRELFVFWGSLGTIAPISQAPSSQPLAPQKEPLGSMAHSPPSLFYRRSPWAAWCILPPASLYRRRPWAAWRILPPASLSIEGVPEQHGAFFQESEKVETGWEPSWQAFTPGDSFRMRRCLISMVYLSWRRVTFWEAPTNWKVIFAVCSGEPRILVKRRPEEVTSEILCQELPLLLGENITNQSQHWSPPFSRKQSTNHNHRRGLHTQEELHSPGQPCFGCKMKGNTRFPL